MFVTQYAFFFQIKISTLPALHTTYIVKLFKNTH